MENKRVKLRGIQRQAAHRLVTSKTEIPHVTTIREIRMDSVLRLRAKLTDELPERKVSLYPFTILAVLSGMHKYPIFNANLEGEDIVYHEDANIGVAITVGDNLIVPVIKAAQRMTFTQMNDACNDLVARSLQKKLTTADFQDGTFTITNSGALGGELFTPIINYPQSAILGIGRIKDKPIVMADGSIVACPLMYLCLSYDHRIINGSQAVGMLECIDAYMQGPVVA
jgi:pyruvate/2-oxoglutarate dehydrogenase complex dihydrolipoamide acyltransferase (E2) component